MGTTGNYEAGPSQRPASFMREALQEAEQALGQGEVPVGAVAVMGGRVIGRGANRVIGDADPTAHAEIVALRQAAQKLGNYRLTGVDLYVTVEPCAMCAGAIIQARVDRLFYGAPDPKAGAVDSLHKLLGDDRLNHRVEVTAGILEEESRTLIARFFREKR
jgi:tRNA(adenine34) deaminase